MNPLMQRLMADATALTRRGDLGAATAAIQQALGLRANGFSPPNPPPSESEFTALKGAEDLEGSLTLEGLTRWVDEPAPAAPVASDSGESWTASIFNHRGHKWAYKLFLPARSGAQPTSSRPLVVMLHGCTQDAEDFAAGTQMNLLAREHGFAVLYPEQGRRANAQRCWNWFKPQHQARDRGEPAMIAALTQSIVDTHGLDGSRVYIAGLSAGGAMADIVGRAYPDVFAAVGVHSGLAAGAANDLPGALQAMRIGAPGQASSRAAARPTIIFHGGADTTVHPANGAAIASACLQSHPGAKPRAMTSEGTSRAGQRYSRTIHSDEDGTPRVEHWQLHGGGHAWSGGSSEGSYTHPGGVDASREMVRFFNANHLETETRSKPG